MRYAYILGMYTGATMKNHNVLTIGTNTGWNIYEINWWNFIKSNGSQLVFTA